MSFIGEFENGMKFRLFGMNWVIAGKPYAEAGATTSVNLLPGNGNPNPYQTAHMLYLKAFESQIEVIESYEAGQAYRDDDGEVFLRNGDNDGWITQDLVEYADGDTSYVTPPFTKLS